MSKSAIVSVVVVVIVLAGGALLLSRNGSDSNNNSTSSTSKTSSTNTMSDMDNMTTPATDNSTTTPSATSSVTIENFAFSPASITVKKGTTVTWTNKDSATHTVTETDNQTGPKSGDLATGKSYSFTFDSVGTFKYDCSIHPNMVGTVTVTE